MEISFSSTETLPDVYISPQVNEEVPKREHVWPEPHRFVRPCLEGPSAALVQPEAHAFFLLVFTSTLLLY